jgi:hypothetical protein
MLRRGAHEAPILNTAVMPAQQSGSRRKGGYVRRRLYPAYGYFALRLSQVPETKA